MKPTTAKSLGLLSDFEIRDLILHKNPIVAGVLDAQSFTRDSSIQPASLDLTIGKILLPEVPDGARGSVEKPMMRHDLAPGETAVVETEEVLKLPGNLAAVVFPPDAVSKEAILMTNPGHVDPGFSGPLKFTLINMGKKPHTLQQGKPVATALFFKLAASPAEDWLKRHDGVAGSGASPEMLDRLSKDFLDIEKRATAQVRSQLLKIGSLGAAITILLSALAVGGAVLPAVLWGPDASLSGRVATLQQRLDETQAELHATTAKLAVLHRAQANGPVKVKP